MTADVLVAGGGIAGSAAAMLLARAGMRVELYEREEFPREKPCGEGLMPAGVAVLERLGLAGAVGGTRFRGVRFHFGDEVAVGAFPRTGGIAQEGIAQRRAVLDRVLFDAATATPGVRAHTRTRVEAPLREHGRVTGLVVAGVARRAGLVVAADGARSPLRRALGLDLPTPRARVGMRAHFRLAPGAEAPPWADVHVGPGHELYVATLPGGELVVSALAEAGALRARAEASFEHWCHAHPRLSERLRGARRITRLRGASPLASRARHGVAPGIVLLGDAAGALDPITGCGMTQALVSAELLAGFAPRGAGAGDGWLPGFERARRERLRDPALLARGLLWLARHPAWVAPALRMMRAWPELLTHLVGVAGGDRTLAGQRTGTGFAGLARIADGPRVARGPGS